MMKTRELTVSMNHEHLVQAVAQYLNNSVLVPWNDNEVVLDADFGLSLNEDGCVGITLTLEELEDDSE